MAAKRPRRSPAAGEALAKRELLPAELTLEAERDIAAASLWSEEHFGQPAASRYRQLILQAIVDLQAEPERPGSLARPEVAPGLRSYHLWFSRQRARARGGYVRVPRHFLLYEVAAPGVLMVLRLVHDASDWAWPLGHSTRTSPEPPSRRGG